MNSAVIWRSHLASRVTSVRRSVSEREVIEVAGIVMLRMYHAIFAASRCLAVARSHSWSRFTLEWCRSSSTGRQRPLGCHRCASRWAAADGIPEPVNYFFARTEKKLSPKLCALSPHVNRDGVSRTLGADRLRRAAAQLRGQHDELRHWPARTIAPPHRRARLSTCTRPLECVARTCGGHWREWAMTRAAVATPRHGRRKSLRP